MHSLWRVFAVALLLALLMPGAHGVRATAQPPTIQADQSAELDFPASATFHLSAAAPVPVDSAELRYITSGHEFSNAAVVEFDATTEVQVEHTVDAQIDYIEPGVDITYYWILSNADGTVAQTEESTVTWIDDSFDWRRLDSDDVSIYVYEDDDEFNQYILQVAQESADAYKQQYDIAEIDPMRIWVYANGSDFSTTLRQNSESWIGGFSLPQAGVIAVPIESGDDYSVDRVISHEVSHHVLYQATRNPFSYPPTWFDEGLAVVGQLAGNENDLQIVLGALEEGALPTLMTLSSSFPTDAAAANRSYATSHIAVEYLMQQWGEAVIGDIVRAFRGGVTADQALLSTIGVDTVQLDAQFRAWLETQL
ncbi:MAG: peptidase MA family metallohydrolase [Thermomicrobiales bacterium]